MKKIFFLPLLILFQHQVVAQKTTSDQFKYKAVYELTYQPDSTDTESKKSEDMFLYIGDGFSRFSSAGKAISDSIMSTMDQSDFNPARLMEMRSQIPRTEFQYDIYKGIPAEKISYAREIVRDKYYYTEDKGLFDWTILNETDTISGFQVQKATTSFAGRDYTAWFTPEIPFPEGPYKFSGLPGLIVKVKDDQDHYLFELKQIQKLENPIPFTFQKEEHIGTTPEKLSKLEEEYKKDPIGFAERLIPGLKITYTEGADQKKMERERKEKLKKENNPIELE